MNSHYRQLQPGLGDHIAPGMTFADILRVAVKLGIHTDRPEEEWIAERLRRRGEETGRLELFAEGRWIQINERRTHDGGIVAVYTDVTELQHRQAQLETAKEEADRATQVKSEFLANMSHELRTPLNAIIGYSQILQEDATDAGNTDTIPDLQKIENAGNHLLHLINDILDLSKIEAGRMEVYVETFDIAGLVRDVETLVQPLATNNRNQLVVDCPPDIGQVSSDITKVKQALLNLLSNATKFTQDGTVTLKVQRTSGPAGHKLAFSVTDTGIGMSEQQMSRLFQAFSQADNSTTRRFGGTGLGLAISRSFARTLGGDLTVSSEPGKGSCFTLTLPADAPKAKEEGAAEQAAARPKPVPEHGSAPRVLVVDDDPSAGHIIGSHLAREGYSLLYAKSGPEAIEMARLHKPDAITLDIMMPQVDGWSVLVALKKDPELAEIPVVIISITNERSLGFNLGASADADQAGRPQRADRGAEAPPHADRRHRREGRPILIVEDDPATREIMTRAVEKLEFRAVALSNGREGMDWLAEQRAAARHPARPQHAGAERLRLPAPSARRRALGQYPGHRLHRAGALGARAPDPRQERPTGHRQGPGGACRAQPGDPQHHRAGHALLSRQGDLTMPKILLVEDNEMNRDMLTRRLARAGYEIVHAADGEEAIVKAEAEAPDLILMDLSLPKIDGWEATRRIRATDGHAGLPVIALTAHAMAGDRERALAAGCDDFDTKPVDLPRLLGKIETLLARPR